MPKAEGGVEIPLSETTQQFYGGGGGGGAIRSTGLQPGQNVRPGDWRCVACANVK